MLKVLVVKGGVSDEREVALRSGRAVAEAARQAGYMVNEFDYTGNDAELIEQIRMSDAALPILHGKGGEDGYIQKFFEENNLPYLGAPSQVSEITFDKIKTHRALEQHNILMPRYELVDEKSFISSHLAKTPFVLKPYDGGSSIDTIIAREVSRKYLDKSLRLLKKHKKMLIEELIIGEEITVPVLDGKALPVINIRPPEGQEFDYTNKYNGQSAEICPVPESIISKELQEEARAMAEKAHHTLGVRHLSRTDMIITKDKKLYVLEINTMPGMTPQSLFPLSALASGLDMVQLTDKLVKMSLEKI